MFGVFMYDEVGFGIVLVLYDGVCIEVVVGDLYFIWLCCSQQWFDDDMFLGVCVFVGQYVGD